MKRSFRAAPIKTVYLGTSDFAARVLRRLAESPHRPALVVTPPDRPKGRGRKLGSPAAADTARDLGIDLVQGNVNDDAIRARIDTAKPDAIVVCAFGQLIKEPLLSSYSMLNIHPSLIPRWRGAAPIERAIMEGDAETGVTIMRVTEGLDSGPVALQEGIAVDPGEDFASLEPRLAKLSGELIVRALDLLGRDELQFCDQDEEAATYAEKIDPAERHLDPARPAAELERVVRAIGPHLGTHLELEGGERLGVRAAAAVEAGPGQGEISAEVGESTEALLLGCSQGALRLDIVQPPGKRPMPAGEFLRGHQAPSRAV